MKNILIIILVHFLITTFLNAKDLFQINDEIIISTELINSSILGLEGNKKTYESLTKKEQDELVETIIKACAVFNYYRDGLSREVFQKIGNLAFSFYDYYAFQSLKIKNKKLPRNQEYIQQSILFYTLWVAQKTKEYENITVTEKEMLDGYNKLKTKINKKESIRYVEISSEDELMLKTFITKMNFSNADKKPRLLEQYILEAEQNKSFNVVHKNNITKDKIDNNLSNKIWKIKEGEYNKSPFKSGKQFYLIFVLEKKKAINKSYEDIKVNLKLSLQKLKLINKLNSDIKKAIEKIKIKNLTNNKDKLYENKTIKE